MSIKDEIRYAKSHPDPHGLLDKRAIPLKQSAYDQFATTAYNSLKAGLTREIKYDLGFFSKKNFRYENEFYFEIGLRDYYRDGSYFNNGYILDKSMQPDEDGYRTHRTLIQTCYWEDIRKAFTTLAEKLDSAGYDKVIMCSVHSSHKYKDFDFNKTSVEMFVGYLNSIGYGYSSQWKIRVVVNCDENGNI